MFPKYLSCVYKFLVWEEEVGYFHRFVRKPLDLNILIKGIVSFIRGTLCMEEKGKKKKKEWGGQELNWNSCSSRVLVRQHPV